MIVFDLKCSGSHVFEAWFATSADFEEQKERGLVRCPICQDEAVEKALMLPNVGRKSNSRPDRDHAAPHVAPNAPASPVATADEAQVARMKAHLQTLAEMQAKIESASDYVGQRFTDEARKMHYGDSERRAIHGEATREQAVELAEEGIAVAPLPFPSRKQADA